MLPYSHSKCHPLVIPRYSTIVKITGGVAHVLTLGVFVAAGKIRGKKFWPGFTNDEELCVCSNNDPSADTIQAENKGRRRILYRDVSLYDPGQTTHSTNTLT